MNGTWQWNGAYNFSLEDLHNNTLGTNILYLGPKKWQFIFAYIGSTDMSSSTIISQLLFHDIIWIKTDGQLKGENVILLDSRTSLYYYYKEKGN